MILGIDEPIVVGDAGDGGGGRDQGAGDGPSGDGAPLDADTGTPDAGADAADGGTVTPPSCKPGGAGMTNCGSGSASCCTSLEVPAGTYDRSYDAVTYTDNTNPATISGFRLDQYEITVGRFRQYVSYLAGGGSLPAAGSGKHTHLNGGQGLHATGGGYETGWDATNWNSQLATSANAWTTNLSCDSTYQTWTASAGTNEKKPVNCVTWYEAYAFCIWDGGFLPSEAEWNAAAAGGGSGTGQRVYPWSSPSTSTTIDCSHANYLPGGAIGLDSGCALAPNNVGTESPAGNGAYGQSDLAGNVWEWNLDWYGVYFNPCTDCAQLTGSAISHRVLRGGSFSNDAGNLLVSYRYSDTLTSRFRDVGARCARTP